MKPAAETRENSWILGALAEEMNLLPEIPNSLYQAAKEDRGLFRQELGRYVECTPEAMLKLPFVLAKTLGPVLGSCNLALLWGLIWSAPARLKEAMNRAGFPEGDDQTESVYGAIMNHPEGIWLGRLNSEKNIEFVATEDSRIHLHVPELTAWLAGITPEAGKLPWHRMQCFP